MVGGRVIDVGVAVGVELDGDEVEAAVAVDSGGVAQAQVGALVVQGHVGRGADEEGDAVAHVVGVVHADGEGEGGGEGRLGPGGGV